MPNSSNPAEPRSLNQIITEKEFLPLVQEAGVQFFGVLAAFQHRIARGGEFSRKNYSHLVQVSEVFESFLDEHGARENKTWYDFAEFVACIRNLAIAAFFIRHFLDRFPFYNLNEDEQACREFFKQSHEAIAFLNASVNNLYGEVVIAGKINDLMPSEGVGELEEHIEIEVNRRLPRTIAEERVKNEEERLLDVCQKYRNAARMVADIKFEKTNNADKLRDLVPAVIDEKRARLFKNLIHSVQSDYDTYLKNTRIEQVTGELKNLRGYISLPLHLLEVVLWLSHFYERHEDEIRTDACKRRISTLVNKNDLLHQIVNFAFRWSVHFIDRGDQLCERLLKTLVKVVRYELPIPKPLGLHARPSTYITLIVRQYEGEAFVVIDGDRFNAKSVMNLLQAGGAIADKGYQTIVFEGDKQILDDIRILAKHNYCEDKNIPPELHYLRAHSK